ncbi:MAG TPA: TIM barrel protein [bacterium]|nr:TIM barrel protein [bacterium]HQL63164.1 TIM barrel protein [bacterium]
MVKKQRKASAAKGQYRFSFGPWNIHEGADPFGPVVRQPFSFAQKIKMYRPFGFEGVQFHDDDVVPADWSASETEKGVKKVKRMLDGEGLVAEFVAPRLWEDPRTIDGAVTSNNPADRKYALERSKRNIDIANMLGTNKIVLWPAREGTYIRESKDPIASVGRMVEYINTLLEYDPNVLILGEMKPNEPMDQAYFPTVGHFIGLAYKTCDPERVGALIETAHCILAGLDPSDEMAYALYHGKLWSVHLNDQNGLKFDEDKTFGSVNLRRAFNQVDLLDQNGYGKNGEFVGLDVKAMRTQKRAVSMKHLTNSREIFLKLLEVSRRVDRNLIAEFIKERDYESLDLYIVKTLMGLS